MVSEFGTGWCMECRTRIEVVDDFEESTYESGGEMGFRVTVFACGHVIESSSVRVGEAPGAPYAGPQATVAATSQPWDLRAADARQDALDHPYGWEWDQ